MSTDDSNRPQNSLNSDSPIADQLNSEDNWSGSPVSPTELIDRFGGDDETIGGRRPRVLNAQIPPCVGETILTQLPLSLMYRYHRDADCMTAWQIGDTSHALLRYDGDTKRPIYMIPPYGESADDLFWMLAESISRDNRFQIDSLDASVTASILAMMRPQYRAGAETLLSMNSLGSQSHHK